MYHGNVVELRFKTRVEIIYQLFAFYHDYLFDSTCVLLMNYFKILLLIDYNIHYSESTSPSFYNNTFIRTPASEIQKY